MTGALMDVSQLVTWSTASAAATPASASARSTVAPRLITPDDHAGAPRREQRADVHCRAGRERPLSRCCLTGAASGIGLATVEALVAADTTASSRPRRPTTPGVRSPPTGRPQAGDLHVHPVADPTLERSPTATVDDVGAVWAAPLETLRRPLSTVAGDRRRHRQRRHALGARRSTTGTASST